MAELRVDILTLFPDTVNAMLHESILGRAVKKGFVTIRKTNSARWMITPMEEASAAS